MRAFKLLEMDDTLLVAITDRKLAAAVRAFDYAWHEVVKDGAGDRTDAIIAALDRLYVEASEGRSH